MPPRPGFIDQFDFLTFYALNACDGPLMVYVECARKPAGEAALALLSFGLGDVIRSLFKPKGLRSARHGRKGRKGQRRAPGIPEIPDLVAERLPGVKQLAARKIDDGLKILWLTDEVMQRVSYTIGIYTIAGDFFYDSLIGVITDDLTKCDFKVAAQRESTQLTKIGVLRWQSYPMPFVKYVRGPISTNSGLFRVGAGQFVCILACDVRNTGAQPETADMRLLVDLFGDNANAQHDLIDLGPFETKQMIVSSIFRGPAFIQAEIGGTTGTPSFELGTCIVIQID